MKKTYSIIGTYQRETETIEEDIETRREADYLLGEYALAFGPGWSLRLKVHREYGVGNDSEGDEPTITLPTEGMYQDWLRYQGMSD